MQRGQVVRSMAGHDKNKFYCVVDLQGERVYIADGGARKLERPKAKSPKHLQETKTALDLEVVTTNKKLKAALAPLNAALTGREQPNKGGNQACQKQM